MRIRWRMTLFGAAVTAAALIVFSILLSSLVAAGATSDQDELLAEVATNAVESIERAPASLFSNTATPVVTDPATSDQAFVVVVDATGEVVFSSAPAGVRIPAAVVVEALESGESGATSNEIRYQARSFDHPDLGPGVVAAGQSVRVSEKALAGFRAFIFLFGIITVLASAVVSWLVAGRALRPLEQLATTADDIAGTGDATRRLPDVKSKDEVGALTRSFNGMLSRLEQTREDLERTLESQKRFVADASHELRSPLTTIRSNAGFLRERPDATTEDRDDALADIETEAERMSRLVHDLLVLARSDAGDEVLLVPVEVGSVIEDVVRKARHLEDVLEVSVGERLVVSANRDSLEQLIWILIDNAATHGDGIISVGLHRDGDHAKLTVEDDGPGIPAGQEESIFDRFHQGANSRDSAGTGLGLAIARSIVQLHNGFITARNVGNGGALLTVQLPLI